MTLNGDGKDINVLSRMTPQEAIKQLEYVKTFTDEELYISFSTSDACDMAIEALRKQIPTPPEEKVKQEYSNLGKEYYCQSCGVMFPFWHHENGRANYCGNCGQRLLEEKE